MAAEDRNSARQFRSPARLSDCPAVPAAVSVSAPCLFFSLVKKESISLCCVTSYYLLSCWLSLRRLVLMAVTAMDLVVRMTSVPVILVSTASPRGLMLTAREERALSRSL